MSAQHTPGPWAVSIVDPHRVVLASGGSKGLEVAQAKEFVPQYREQSLANARLIAAAPDLLKAAEQALKALEGVDELLHRHGFMQGLNCPAIKPLRAAIAKATGAA